MFIDSHCHLSFPELRERLPEILQAMADAQVSQALCICTTLEEFDQVHALTAQPQLWATVGVHPDNEGVREPTLDDLLAGAARSLLLANNQLRQYALRIEDQATLQERNRIGSASGSGPTSAPHGRPVCRW